MGLADLHVHSIHSYDGTVTVPAILKHVAYNTKLNVIALTDHDQTCGVAEAVQLAPAYGVEVIPGCEVSTAEGHLLTLFVDQAVQPGLSYLETILRTGEMGGLCIAPHPTTAFINSVSFKTVRQVLQNPDAARILVGIEAYNGGLVLTHRNAHIAAICQTFPLAQVGNSDAHVLKAIGQGATRFKGKTAEDLKQALHNRETQIQQEHGMTGLEVLWTYLFQHLVLKMGWAPWNAGPLAPVIYRRVGQISRCEQAVPIS
jgi:predicted metal-dependent phosphoesterase TrpH